MHKNKTFYQNSTIEIKGIIIGAERPLVMGIINLTPDSFYEGSRKQSENEIIETAAAMLNEGADILDLGAYSTRPQAEDISEELEWERLSTILPKLRAEFPNTILSIDTFRSGIAQKSLENGADIINDISGGTLDNQMFDVISKWNCPYILMHMRGTPQNMNNLTSYENLIDEIIKFLYDKTNELKKMGLHKIIVDPGFGFAKNTEQNFELLSRLEELQSLGVPILAGLSRKSMIYKTLGITSEDALNGTTALNVIALLKGAKIIRVHDVKEAVECVKLYSYL